MTSNTNLQVIVGLGDTGLSCVRFLKKRGHTDIAVNDTREKPPHLSQLQNQFPDTQTVLGGLDEKLLTRAERIILSPGVAKSHPLIQAQIKKGKQVIGDIELFAQEVKVPVIAITGTNAKSTVTTLVGKMGEKAGFHVAVGGNLGIPVLDLMAANPRADLFVLELSSFQLETTYSLAPKVATVLNVTPDHMDRYDTFIDYQRAKLRIYNHCRTAVMNLDDQFTQVQDQVAEKLFFSLSASNANTFGLLTENNTDYLSFQDQLLLDVRELPILGKHYQANALASLAIGYGMAMPMADMITILREFKGLPHRCQFVREMNGVSWINDSKGTNVGATQAAIYGLADGLAGKLIWIAGGVGKQADFSPLAPLIKEYVRHAILIGQDANEIAKIIDSSVPYSYAATLEEAVNLAKQYALPKDYVLLSPACASFDMFKHFEHRGDVFMEIVHSLI